MRALRPGWVGSRLPAPKLMMILYPLEKGIHISLVPLGLCWIKGPHSKKHVNGEILGQKPYSKTQIKTERTIREKKC